jgi:hypothetical protein
MTNLQQKYSSFTRKSEHTVKEKLPIRTIRFSSIEDAERYDVLFEQSDLATKGVFLSFMMDCASIHLSELGASDEE